MVLFNESSLPDIVRVAFYPQNPGWNIEISLCREWRGEHPGPLVPLTFNYGGEEAPHFFVNTISEGGVLLEIIAQLIGKRFMYVQWLPDKMIFFREDFPRATMNQLLSI